MDLFDAVKSVRVRRTEKTIMRSKLPGLTVEQLSEMDMLDQIENGTSACAPPKGSKKN